jgi:hypothetical protein
MNSTQDPGWRRSIEVMEAGTPQPRTLSLFSRGSRRATAGCVDRPAETVAHARCAVVKEGPDFEVDDLERAEGALDPAEALLVGDGGGIVELLGGHRGTQGVEAV